MAYLHIHSMIFSEGFNSLELIHLTRRAFHSPFAQITEGWIDGPTGLTHYLMSFNQYPFFSLLSHQIRFGEHLLSFMFHLRNSLHSKSNHILQSCARIAGLIRLNKNNDVVYDSVKNSRDWDTQEIKKRNCTRSEINY